MKLTNNNLKSLIKEELINEGFFDLTPVYSDNEWIDLNENNVKTNTIFIRQWGNNGITIDLNKAIQKKGGWLFETGKFYQSVESDWLGVYSTDTNKSRMSFKNAFIKKGNGQMIYAVPSDSGNVEDKTVGVGLRGGCVVSSPNGLRIVLTGKKVKESKKPLTPEILKNCIKEELLNLNEEGENEVTFTQDDALLQELAAKIKSPKYRKFLDDNVENGINTPITMCLNKLINTNEIKDYTIYELNGMVTDIRQLKSEFLTYQIKNGISQKPSFCYLVGTIGFVIAEKPINSSTTENPQEGAQQQNQEHNAKLQQDANSLVEGISNGKDFIIKKLKLEPLGGFAKNTNMLRYYSQQKQKPLKCSFGYGKNDVEAQRMATQNITNYLGTFMRKIDDSTIEVFVIYY